MKLTDLKVCSLENPIGISGKTESDNSAYVPYTGPSLSAGHIYHWNAEVTVSNGEITNGTGTFELPLSPQNRKAEWITSDQSPAMKALSKPVYMLQHTEYIQHI